MLRAFSLSSGKTRLEPELVRLLVITFIIFVVMGLASPGLFLSWSNLSSMAFQFPEFGILSLAVMIGMLTGGIDLSVIGIANLSAVVAAMIMVDQVGPAADASAGTLVVILVAIVASVVAGMVCGILNGLSISVVGIPPILATLGSGLVFTGIAIVITDGKAIVGLPSAFSVVGNGAIAGIPVPLLIFAAAAAFLAYVLEGTGLGLKIYMLGTNPRASMFAGLNNRRVLIEAYMLSGVYAAAAGLVMMSRANSAKADYGSSYMLLSILIGVLGGVNPDGGSGKVLGVTIAVLALQFLASGFNILQYSNFAKDMVWGLMLLIVLLLNARSRSRV